MQHQPRRASSSVRSARVSHAQSPTASARGSNGISVLCAGFRPPTTASHSRAEAAMTITAEIMKNDDGGIDAVIHHEAAGIGDRLDVGREGTGGELGTD